MITAATVRRYKIYRGTRPDVPLIEDYSCTYRSCESLRALPVSFGDMYQGEALCSKHMPS